MRRLCSESLIRYYVELHSNTSKECIQQCTAKDTFQCPMPIMLYASFPATGLAEIQVYTRNSLAPTYVPFPVIGSKDNE